MAPEQNSDLINRLTDVLWDAFATVPNCYADRQMDVIDTGGNLESFRMQNVAEYLVVGLGLEQLFAPATRIIDGTDVKIDPDTQWETDSYDHAAERAEMFREPVATRIVSRWEWSNKQPPPWAGPADISC